MADEWDDDTPTPAIQSLSLDDNTSNTNGGYKGKSSYNDGGDRPRYNRNRDDNGDGGDRPRYNRNRDDNGDGGDRPRYNRNRDNDESGERRGGFRRRDNENGDNEGGDRRPFRRRDNENGDGDGGERRPYRRRDGEENDKPEGDGEKKREIYIPEEPTNDETEIFGSTIKAGINFSKFDKVPVKVTDTIPKGLNSWKDSELREYLLTNVEKAGYEILTPIQKYAIPTIMKGIDLMACAQTGSGKTAAYLLPILHKLLAEEKMTSVGKPQCLIVSPTRELTIQIYNECRKFSHGSIIKVCLCYGGTGTRYQSDNINKGCHILVATPGRLNDFVEKGFIDFSDIRFVVLDEADRMLDMGFKPDVEKFMKHPTMVPATERNTLMFSATFPEDVQRMAGEFLNDYGFISVGIVGSASTDVKQEIVQVARFEKRKKLMEMLDEADDVKGTIVFVETKRNADYLASLLSETKYPTTSIHGDREQREREEAIKTFKSGKMKILVATSVAARGLDIPGVQHIINYDLPKSIDEYVHRIGRTGRVGNQGRATSFFDPDNNAPIAPDLVRILQQANEVVPDFLSTYSGGSYTANEFGASDIRNQKQNEPIKSLEAEEEW